METNKKSIPWLCLLAQLAIPLAVGGLSALLTGNAFTSYQALNRPPLSPPAMVFPIVWTILYLLMGTGSYLAIGCDARLPENRPLVWVYAAQLLFNLLWTPVFFRLEWRLFSFFWLLALLALVAVMARQFYRRRPLAGYLQIPYLLWLLFAAYLNLGTYLLN